MGRPGAAERVGFGALARKLHCPGPAPVRSIGRASPRFEARSDSMESTAYIALSRQMVLARQMEVIAHNVANMTATGFKA